MKHNRVFALGTFLGMLSLLLLLGSCSGERDDPAAGAAGGEAEGDTYQASGETAAVHGTEGASDTGDASGTAPGGAVAGADAGSTPESGAAPGQRDVTGAGVRPGEDPSQLQGAGQTGLSEPDQAGDVELEEEEEGPEPFPDHIRVPTLRAQDGRPTAPDVPLTDINGRTITMEHLRGQVVLVVFWATWCPPCKREIPHLVHLQETYGDLGLTILAPSLDQKGLAAIKPFLRSRPDINYTIIPSGHRLSMAYGGVNRIPTSYLIDKQGRVIEQIMGLRSGEELEGLVMAALKEEA